MRTAKSLVLGSWCLIVPVGSPLAEPAPPLMLAGIYQADAVTLSEYWVSEKYDGVRAYWDGEKLITRHGSRVQSPAWFTADWPRQPLDGELWIGRGEFETLLSTVRDETPNEPSWRRVRFMAFDLPAHPGDFTTRLAALQKLLSTEMPHWLQAVPQFKIADPAALDSRLRQIVAAGGEGLMLHRAHSIYHAERSNDLLKLKLHQDSEAQVIAHLPGKGKYEGMLGALLVQRPDGVKFRLGSGFTDAQRRNPPPIGAWVTYSHDGLTAKKVPRFARFVRVREELAADTTDFKISR